MRTRRIYFLLCSSIGCLVAVIACAATQASGARTSRVASQPQPANAANSVWGGVYTLAQAESGETSYGLHCAWCHGKNLEGDEDICAPALTGAEFWKQWGGLSVGALYGRIQKTMPESKGGSLSDQEYAAIVSFLLKANEFPAGQKDLRPELAALERIMITRRGA